MLGEKVEVEGERVSVGGRCAARLSLRLRVGEEVGVPLLRPLGGGTVSVVVEGVEDAEPVVAARRTGDGGGRTVLGEPLDVFGPVEESLVIGVDEVGAPLPFFVDILSTLATLLASPISDDSRLVLNVVHAHSSSGRLAESSHLALHPAPTPSIAAFGLSCSLNKSQLAYTHLSSQ